MVDYDSKYLFVAKSSPDAVPKSLLKNRMHNKKSGEKDDKKEKNSIGFIGKQIG